MDQEMSCTLEHVRQCLSLDFQKESPGVVPKKGAFMKILQNSQYHSFSRQACNFNWKETLAQVLSHEFSEIFKNTFFMEYLWCLLLGFLLKRRIHNPIRHLWQSIFPKTVNYYRKRLYHRCFLNKSPVSVMPILQK